MNKKYLWKTCIALMLFVVMLGAGLFYLHYEGVIRYQYVLNESPDLSLTIEDAVQIIRPKTSDYETEYNLNHVLVYEPQIPIAAVRIVFSQLPETRIHAKVSFPANDVVRIQDNRPGSNEILFTFPKMESEEVRIIVHDIDDVQTIEMYENSAYVDETKSIPHTLNICIAVLLAALLAAAYLMAGVDLRSGKGLAFPTLYLILEIAVLSFCLQTRKYEVYSQNFEIAVYGLFVVASLVLFLVYRMLFIWHAQLHWIFAIGGMTIGIVMMLMIPPFAVPDELTHFHMAYAVSNQMMGTKGEQESEMRWEDLRFKEKQHGVYNTAISYERYMALAADFTLVNEAEGMKHFDAELVQNVPWGYIVTGAAINVAKLLNLSGMMLFYLGRFANLMVFIFLISVAIYLLPFGKGAVMCVAIAPVSMHLAASYSYDPIVTAIAFLYVAYVLRLWAQEKDISLKQFMMCCVLGMLLAPSKVTYAPMVATVFLISDKKYGFGGNKRWLLKFIVVAISWGTLLAMQSAAIGKVAQGKGSMWSDGAVSYNIAYLLSNIRETINLYLHTFEKGSDWYIPNFFSGFLGYQGLSAYNWVSILFWALFLTCCQRSTNESQVCCTLYKRWGVIVLGFGSIVLIMLSMLLDFTVMGSYSIQGVQGRYFIPILILMIPIFRNTQIQTTEKAIRWCGFAAIWTSLFAIISMMQVMPRLLVFA